MNKRVVCPECGAEIGWDLQDTFRIADHILSERLMVCGAGCGWMGDCVALFPWRGNPKMQLHKLDTVGLARQGRPE